MNKKIILSALIVSFTTACSHVEQGSLPNMPVASNYKGDLPSALPVAVAPLEFDGWWMQYADPDLDRFQRLLVENSPDLASALARYQQARAATDVVRADRVPTIGAAFDGARNRQSQRRPLRGSASPDYYESATLAMRFDYELDLWGRISQQIAAGVAEERAAMADLAAARLILQVRLADTMITLRGTDREILLLSETEAAYRRAVDMVGHRRDAGVASGLDLAQAQGQLETAHSQLQQARARRATLENTVAALVGVHPSTFTIAPAEVADSVPVIPAGLPSDLLQRRPDIVAAQQRIAAATANVGLAHTAYFPSVRLSALGGYQSDDFSNLIAAPNLFWAVGPGLLATLYDGGRRRAEVARAEAVLNEVGSIYRGTVLGAFQQVEDQLVLLSRYSEAASAERRATDAAQRALTLANNRYRDGASSYLDVVAAQTNALLAQRNALDLTTRQRRATVQLVAALGGGWTQEDSEPLADR